VGLVADPAEQTERELVDAHEGTDRVDDLVVGAVVERDDQELEQRVLVARQSRRGGGAVEEGLDLVEAGLADDLGDVLGQGALGDLRDLRVDGGEAGVALVLATLDERGQSGDVGDGRVGLVVRLGGGLLGLVVLLHLVGVLVRHGGGLGLLDIVGLVRLDDGLDLRVGVVRLDDGLLGLLRLGGVRVDRRVDGLEDVEGLGVEPGDLDGRERVVADAVHRLLVGDHELLVQGGAHGEEPRVLGTQGGDVGVRLLAGHGPVLERRLGLLDVGEHLVVEPLDLGVEVVAVRAKGVERATEFGAVDGHCVASGSEYCS
jgi:hypothetical protein